MNTLRAKVVILLVVAIIGVVALATAATITIIRGQGPQADIDGPLADQLRTIAKLAERTVQSGEGASLQLLQSPPSGQQLRDISLNLNAALKREGSALQVEVTRSADGSGIVAAIPIAGNGWLAVPLPVLPKPPRIWPALVGWLTLTTIGVTAISLYAADKIIRPLAMLNAAVGAIGPDGILPKVDEHGPAEVKATAAAINRLSAHLQFATESRMRLIAGAGHDLRTPMTRMRLRAEFIPEDERSSWLADLDELERIADSAIRLVQEEVDPKHDEPLRLDLLAGEVVEELRGLGLVVKYTQAQPAFITAAPLALKRALRNLLVNAATHGRGAALRVECNNAAATAVIDDNGPGIPSGLLDQVFEPFFRVDPARRQSIPGAGLGLAISKEIVQRYHGSIKIENKREGGLRQTLLFPAASQGVS